MVYLVHPGGPFFRNKDIWGIPGGAIEKHETAESAAVREFIEETGHSKLFNSEEFLSDMLQYFDSFKINNKKIIAVFTAAGNVAGPVKSNVFEMVWPPGTEKLQSFPEIDKGRWFAIEEAKEKVFKNHQKIIESFEEDYKKYDRN